MWETGCNKIIFVTESDLEGKEEKRGLGEERGKKKKSLFMHVSK